MKLFDQIFVTKGQIADLLQLLDQHEPLPESLSDIKYQLLDLKGSEKKSTEPEAHWILKSRTPGFFGREDEDNFECSACHKLSSWTFCGIVENEVSEFCPHCGVKMSKDIERLI